MLPVPFTQVYLTGRELEYLRQVVEDGAMTSNGPFTRRCAERLSQLSGGSDIVLTNSCTAALEMAAILMELGPGDEVILPSFTFVSTASAFARTGAQLVFADVDPATLNLDPDSVAQQVNSRSRAIVPVHYAGVAAPMTQLKEIAEQHQLALIEDAAQAVGASYQQMPLGSIGQLGTFSFHHTKNLVAGEAGALCVNDPDLLSRAMILRDKGTNREAFLAGQVDKYSWVDQGSSYLPAELAAAFLLAQLEGIEQIQDSRQQAYEFYYQQLQPLDQKGYLQRPTIPAECQSNYHLFHLLVADQDQRDRLLASLNQQQIGAVFHYVPLHLSAMGQRLAPDSVELPVTTSASQRLIRLPLFAGITKQQQQRVVAAIEEFFQ